MEEWLKQTLPAMVNEQVIVFRDGLTMAIYDPLHAAPDFANVTTPPTYAALSTLPIAQGD